eukprot:EG_transcript_64277
MRRAVISSAGNSEVAPLFFFDDEDEDEANGAPPRTLPPPRGSPPGPDAARWAPAGGPAPEQVSSSQRNITDYPSKPTQSRPPQPLAGYDSEDSSGSPPPPRPP